MQDAKRFIQITINKLEQLNAKYKFIKNSQKLALYT